jgi:predicted GIY-YIG superfamily endonuclease
MFVYLIKCINKDGFIKIGVAKEVQSRLDTMQTGCPYKLELLASIKCVSRKQAYELEGRLHRLFKNKRVRGEWFRKVSMYKAIDVLNKDVIKQNKTPHSQKEWDDAAMALEAGKRL